MSDQIDEHVKEERNQDLLEVVNKSNHRILERLVGSQVEVLCEGPSKTNRARLMGRTRTNKIVVFPPSRKRPEQAKTRNLLGSLYVRIERANGFSLYWDAPAGVAHLQSQVENLRHRIQTHTRSVEFDA